MNEQPNTTAPSGGGAGKNYTRQELALYYNVSIRTFSEYIKPLNFYPYKRYFFESDFKRIKAHLGDND